MLFAFFWVVTQTQAQNNALNFDGSDDVVNCGNNANLKISTGTIEAWVKSSGGGSSWRGIIIKQMAYGLFLKDNVLVTHDWSVGLDRSTGVNLADNQWHHVAMSFQSGVTNGTKIYIDGNLALTTTITVNNQTEPFLIGDGNVIAGQVINGSIDAVRVWNVVRTQAEIQATRDAELTAGTGLISAYNFNQGTANGTNTGITTLNDAVGSNNGTIQNFALTGTTSNWVSGFVASPEINVQGNSTTIADGDNTPSVSDRTDFGMVSGSLVRTFTIQNTGSATLNITSITSSNTQFVVSGAPTSIAAGGSATFNVTFTPTNNVTQTATITINNNDSDEGIYDFTLQGTQAPNNALNFDGTDDVVNCGNNANLQIGIGTIEAWVKSSGGGSSFRGIISKQAAYGLFLKDNILIGYDWSVPAAERDRSTGVNLADNQWHHVAMSFQSGVANGTKIYIDGNLALTTSITVNNQLEPLRIGGSGVPVTQVINGSIDAVRIWSVVRTQAEIQANRHAELSSGTGLIAAYNFNQGTANGTNTGITTLNDAVGSNNVALQNFALTGTTSNWVSGFCTTPSVSIALTSGTNPKCAGTSVTFTAIPTNGGTSPSFQWKKDGNNVGSNSATYTDAGSTGGVISCVMTVGTGICPTTPTATSSNISLVNYTPLNPTLSTTNGNCVGSNNLTLSDASTASQIQWQQNGTTVSTVGLSYANTGTTVVGTGVEGSAANQINHTTSVFVDVSGNVYAIDYANYRIQKWAMGATSGVTVAGGNGKGTAANQLYDPHGLFVDGAGNIYFADGDADRIQKWAVGASTGTTVAGGNGRGSAANQFKAVTDVFVDASGNIYVADALNHRVQRWAAGASTGTTIAGTGVAGSAANQLNFPQSIFIDVSGNLYITDFTNERVQKWAVGATSGTTVAGGNGNGSAANQFKGPSDVYVDVNGNMYVADAHNERIQRFAVGSTTGVTVAGGNGQGSAANQFNNAYALCLDNNGNIYVADYANSRIQKWATTGISTTYTPSVSGSYQAIASTSNGCSYTSNNVIINPITTPSVSIALTSGTNPTCPNAAVTFTATPTNGGTSPSFQWKKDGNNVGTNSPTYTDATATSGIISCIMTVGTGICTDAASATSSGITLVVNNCTLKLSAKVFIQGAYQTSTGFMNDGLRSNGRIPTSQPYNTLIFNGSTAYLGSETVAQSVLDVTGSDAIVDWVLIELRDAANPSNVPANGRRAALLQRDGDIVDINGTSAVNFPNLTEGNYHVIIRHRLCLATRTNTAITFSYRNTPSVNFTDNSNALSSSQKLLTTGVYGLYIGDTDRSGVIASGDVSSTRSRNPTIPTTFIYNLGYDLDFNASIFSTDVLIVRGNTTLNQVNLNL